MVFPGSPVLASGVQIWHGTRMCTADGLPLVGASGLPGIWLNLGHGSCGAAIAQGCASMLSDRSEEHTSELQSPCNLVCRLLLEKKKLKQRHCERLPLSSRRPPQSTYHLRR